MRCGIGSGPRRVYVIGGYYGDQPEGPAVAAALPELLAGLAGGESSTVRVLRDMNPDGSAAKIEGDSDVRSLQEIHGLERAKQPR